MKTRFIYNNINEIPSAVANLIGASSFGGLIYNRKTLCERAFSNARKAGISDCTRIDKLEELKTLRQEVRFDTESTIYIHMLSSAVVTDTEAFALVLKKLTVAKTLCALGRNCPLLICCNSPTSFVRYLERFESGHRIQVEDIFKDVAFIASCDFILDISSIDTFVSFFSGSFSVRHFNHIKANQYEIRKESGDKKKIKSEHDFYYLLPPEMQRWFVQPYSYEENEQNASYAMERLSIPDASLLWIHQAFDKRQMRMFQDKIMYFISTRPERACSDERSQNTTKALFIDKVISRFGQLKGMKQYEQINTLLAAGTDYSGMSEIMENYEKLFNAHSDRLSGEREVVGHGDFCFSNMLYDKDKCFLKLIDPKGALKEDDLWTHPYYDLAKVSHSVLGLYDFLNHNLFEIVLDERNMLQLEIISPEIGWQRDMFVDLILQHGYDPFLCRLCEASLFLSMLPLHMDFPKKVVGFILTAIQILKELENYA